MGKRRTIQVNLSDELLLRLYKSSGIRSKKARQIKKTIRKECIKALLEFFRNKHEDQKEKTNH